LVLRFVTSLPALVFILLPVIMGGADAVTWFNLSVAILYGIVVLPWIAVFYIRFRYWITDREVIIHSGVLTRRRRNIPIERIQNIDIEQGLLSRMLGTAKVAIYTAGGSQAEGVLEFVLLSDAQDIRSVIREKQKDLVEEEGVSVGMFDGPVAGDETPVRPALFEMDPRQVALAGAFRFSLLYLAAIYSVLQYINPDPTILLENALRGPLKPLQAEIEASPWFAGMAAFLTAVLLGWLSGILLTINKYHGFRLERDGRKLHRRHGLLTRTEGTIPLRRVQTYIVRTNPLMRKFGWFRLELQTIGMDTREAGFHVAVPFGRAEDVVHVMNDVAQPLGSTWAELDWQPVSPLSTRRFLIRWSLLIVLVGGGVGWFWTPGLWALAVLPVLFPLAAARYRNMGWARKDDVFAVRRGIFGKHTWLIPVHKLQTISLNATWFQRRLGLETLYVDTAGASEVSPAVLVDVTRPVGEHLMAELYAP
jgi:putative membrane protein